MFGFGGGRQDVFEPERDTYWGAEEYWVSEGAPTRITRRKCPSSRIRSPRSRWA